MSYRKWYRKSWEKYYRHQGWSSLCDLEVEDELPAPPLWWKREPYFEEWEEPLVRSPPAEPDASKRSRRAARARKEEHPGEEVSGPGGAQQ